ncbi:metallophosphoesterase family protein [Lachnospiraceae bacterium CLA-AA-H246]|uniref:Metallophosphoesterase family protein n=1 Tax=Hominisplanchenecus faecis TaxID=2885351 RepID=A0ABS8EXY9_9FIRM|nr:metallophosphoesterase family protein [Hominisplanchenecus faecis]MCC2149932.1 metallophosphoesterase family protein [Hominisplanchenecus faecis]
MKKMKALQIIAAAMAVTVAATSTPVNVFAYGETSASSTLFSDTQNISDYTTWKDTVWNKKDDQGNLTGEGESYDSSRIILTPGKTAKDLGFAWYSQKKGEPAVKIGKKEDLSDAQEFKGTATEINRSNQKNTYKASNKVTVEGLFEENTTYYYSYTDDVKNPAWSEVQSYTTKKTTNFQTILVGDPQIGASGSQGQGTADDINIAVDTFNWNKTLEQAKITAPNASFILSAGDQIDYAGTDSSDGKNVRESEYAGFTYPALLRMLPLATTIGNHESKGTDYKYHYNNPNSEDGLGSTNSGSDYYFSYGNVLFISLNSNNRNTVEHRELLKKAVESNPDAKWKVVMFHHDIYGSGQPHSDTDGANLRALFAPLMDEFGIDMCLTGHDHSYARSYLMADGTAIQYDDSVAINPEGTLYIAAGSASGSKFYKLATTKQYYIAERSNTQIPTFSTIDFSDESIVIKTYDYNGNKYADDYTLYKTGEKVSMKDLIAQAKEIKNDGYTEASWNKLQSEIAAAEDLMKYTAEDKGAAQLAAVYDKTNDADNANDMLNYYGYAQSDYKRGDSTALKAGFSTLLDKTMDMQLLIAKKKFENQYDSLLEAKVNLQKKETNNAVNDNNNNNNGNNTDNNVMPAATAKLQLKAGKKTVKAGSTIALKKGKTVQLSLTINGVTGKNVKYKTSNKKVVKISSTGKMKAVKKSKKKVKVTASFGKQKITFKVKTK